MEERRGRAVRESLASQLDALGLNPMMLGIEAEDLADIPQKRVEAYQRQVGEYARAVRSWMPSNGGK